MPPKDRYRYFRIEAQELLDGLSQGVLALEGQDATPDPELVKRLLRLAHTLKGAARVVGENELAERAHKIEDLLAPLREGRPLEPGGIDALLKLLDGVRGRLATLTAPAADAMEPGSGAQRTGSAPPAAPAPAAASVPAAAPPPLALSAPGPAAGAGSGRLREAGPTRTRPATGFSGESAATGLAAGGEPAPAPRVAAPSPPRPLAAEQSTAVRVEVGELDRLLEGVSEALVAAAAVEEERSVLLGAVNELRTLAAPRARGRARLRFAGEVAEGLGAAVRGLSSPLQRLEERAAGLRHELETLRERVTELRLVPAEVVFGDLERAVRDAARAAGREAELRTRGGETRLDAHVLNSLRGPLVHLVRNAVAHAIEDAPARAVAGKPARGLVEVSIERSGHRAVIRCRDDGRGLDPEVIRREAVRRGLIGAERAGSLGLVDAVRLLMRGGLSTSGAVTSLAGRGVGLDAVREALERLRGEVVAESLPGQGTTFELRVPVSLSSLPALAVQAGGVPALLPLDSVARTVRLGPDDVSPGAGGARAMVEGQPLPYAPLTAVLRLAAQGGASAPSAVVLRDAGGLVALGVDRIRAVRTVLVRSLPPGVEADAVVAGAAFDEDGPPSLVLSPRAVGDAIRAGVTALAPAAAPVRPPLLVIDDSLTTRMLEQSILESAGYEVDLATSAEEGLEKAHRRAYGLFVVDVEMPGMSGFEFVALTRSDARLQAVPAILVTSRNDPADKRRGKEVGARAYMVKSEFDQQALLETVRSLVG